MHGGNINVKIEYWRAREREQAVKMCVDLYFVSKDWSIEAAGWAINRRLLVKRIEKSNESRQSRRRVGMYGLQHGLEIAFVAEAYWDANCLLCIIFSWCMGVWPRDPLN